MRKKVYIYNKLLGNRKRVRKIIIILFYLFFIAFSLTTQAQESKNILLLNSYHHGYTWTDELTNGIRSTIEKRPNTTLYVEYLEAKRNPGYHKSIAYENAFSRKYKGKKFDIVIISDNAALDFWINHKKLPCWKKASFVATGISNYEDYANISNLHIVPETSTFEQSFKHIFRFFPDAKELVFVTDTLLTGQIHIEEVRNVLNHHYPGVELIILHDFTIQTLPVIIKQYKYPTVIYASTITVDRNGEPVNENNVARIVQENAKAPLFSGFYCERMSGYIGGSFTSGFENGQAGGKVALMIINENPNLSKITYPPVKTIFDYTELQKYKIPEKLIPDNAIVLNKPEPFFKKNKQVLIITGIIIINLLLIIVLFVYLWLSQKKHKHKLLEAAQQAQQANKLKTIFLENVSHEMRTPLNSIIGFSDVLSEMITKNTEKQYLKIISDNALDLYNLISNIFNFSLLKSHQVSINYSEVIPSQLIEEIITESYLKQKIEEGSINLNLDYEQNEISIITDREKLYQILKSTINNAFKYTMEGTVTIKFRLVHNKSLNFKDATINTNEKASHILFKIKDTGKGITPEELEYIFEPFRQADEKDTNANRGLGLGLSISKSIIEIMGGRIRIKSKPGKGTNLHFSIPFKPAKTKRTVN
jgi:signal transduction histidine kinase